VTETEIVAGLPPEMKRTVHEDTEKLKAEATFPAARTQKKSAVRKISNVPRIESINRYRRTLRAMHDDVRVRFRGP
jgi:hypothetical protein